MRELPILFNGLSVRQIIRGFKTETRRVIKTQPTEFFERPNWMYASKKEDGHSGIGWYCGEEEYPDDGSIYYGDPYGSPGTILWVRESAVVLEIDDWRQPRQLKIVYKADDAVAVVEYPERLKGKPQVGKYLAYGCYKEACRIKLKVIEKHPELLHQIDGDGMTAEGYPTFGSISFQQGWDNINKAKFPYDSNPWVWVARFSVESISVSRRMSQ